MPISNFYEDCYREWVEKVWLQKNNNCGRRRVLKFSIDHNVKFQSFKKKNMKFEFSKFL